MEKSYGHGEAVSTPQPDQLVSDAIPRAIPIATIENCLRYARSCARYEDLRGRPPLLEPNPAELYRRVHTRINGTEHAVYGMVRRATQVGFPGAWVSYDELGELVGRVGASAKRAVKTLLELELLEVMPMLVAGGPASTKGYDRSRTRNVYRLGRRARPPSRVDGNRGRGASARSVPAFSNNLSNNLRQLSDPEGQKSKDFCPSSGLLNDAPTLADSSSRIEVSASPKKSATASPGMPASPGEQRLPNEKSKVRTTESLATLGDVAKITSSKGQKAHQRELELEAELRALAPLAFQRAGGAQ